MGKYKIDSGMFVADQPRKGEGVSDRFTYDERLNYHNETQTSNQAIVMKIESYLQDFNNPHSVEHVQDMLNKYVIGDDLLKLDGTIGKDTQKYINEFRSMSKYATSKFMPVNFGLIKQEYDFRDHPRKDAIIDSIYLRDRDMYDPQIHWGD